MFARPRSCGGEFLVARPSLSAGRAKVIAGMTTSLDGFVADRDGSASRLYPDLAALRETAYMKGLIEETGAVLMGKRTFEMGDPDSYVGDYEFQVPIFVLTHNPPQVARSKMNT